MTTEEVASYFRVGKSTVYSWASRGLLQSTKVGGSRRWHRKAVLDLAEREGASSLTEVPTARSGESKRNRRRAAGRRGLRSIAEAIEDLEPVR